LAATAALVVAAGTTAIGLVSLTGTASLVVTGVTIGATGATLVAVTGMVVTPSLTVRAQVAMVATTTLSAGAGGVLLGSVLMAAHATLVIAGKAGLPGTIGSVTVQVEVLARATTTVAPLVECKTEVNSFAVAL
jgi:hypothetical protein